MKIIDVLTKKEKEDLRKFTEKLLEEKDLSIEACMKHDAYRRINGAIRQIKWGER